jgi:hypothetical protein
MDLLDFFSEGNMSALARKQEREIFGRRRTLPEDEMRIAFNSDLPHEEKMKKLNAIRQAKALKRAASKAARTAGANPQTFEQRISDSDALRARGMGIRLA